MTTSDYCIAMIYTLFSTAVNTTIACTRRTLEQSAEGEQIS
jgi:hypothetical protein